MNLNRKVVHIYIYIYTYPGKLCRVVVLGLVHTPQILDGNLKMFLK